MQDINEIVVKALAGLPCPVSRSPAAGNVEQYITFSEVSAAPVLHSSNRMRRIEHVVGIHIYSQEHYWALLCAVLERLIEADALVDGWGPEDYEEDTGYHHMPINARWAQYY